MKAIACCLYIFLGLTTCASAIEIEWSVLHPFRYFKNASDLDMHQHAYEQLRTISSEKARFAPISNMERMLNNPIWWSGNPYLEKLKAARRSEGRSEELDIQLGWGSFLTNASPEARGQINQTCWNENRQRHSNCDESELHGTTGQTESFDRDSGGERLRITKGRYIYPKFHRVEISLRNPDAEPGTCRWVASRPVFLKGDDNYKMEYSEVLAPCSAVLQARVPYQPEIGARARGVVVRVERQDGDGLVDAVATIVVRDMLIIGMGDSYSSGEGNPEIPAKLHPTRAIGPAEPSGVTPRGDGRTQFYGIPRRSPAGGGSAAKWTDRRCHRSIYSYQTRVALQLAIAPDGDGNHHHAVTYMHFSCSGAEITEDILFASEGRECMAAAIENGNRRDPNNIFYTPQISKISNELCQFSNPLENRNLTEFESTAHPKDKLRLLGLDHYSFAERPRFIEAPADHCGFQRSSSINSVPRLSYCRRNARARKIDLLLTSAGGNDIGFAKIVAKAIVDDEKGLMALAGNPLFKDFLFVDEDEARKRLDRLPHRIEVYKAALDNFLGVRGNAIISLGYPNLIHRKASSGEDRLCPTENAYLDVSKYLRMDGNFLRSVERIVEGKCSNDGKNCGLIDTIRKAVSSGSNKWRFVDGHRDQFRTHGICSTREDGPDESGKGAAEIQGIPYKFVDLTKSGTSEEYSATWKRYDPTTEYFPYESRASGFRSPVQDYLNIQYFKGNMPDDWETKGKESALFLMRRIQGGSFHPTAEAHAHIADHVYCTARDQLFGSNDKNSCGAEDIAKYGHPW